MEFFPEEANKLYDQLPEFAETRLREITGMFEPFMASSERHARLVARLSCLLGLIPPTDTQDRVIRDLTADAFDFLYESKDLIVGGKLAVAYPLARRAYESVSLLHLCALSPSWAEKWEAGKHIANAEVRRQLAKHPMGEPEEPLRELYRFFSTASHPNRGLVAARFLGEGNEFVLGVIGVPDLPLVLDYCSRHIDLWHWFVATVSYFYKSQIAAHDDAYFKDYHDAFVEAEGVSKWLDESRQRLDTEAQSGTVGGP